MDEPSSCRRGSVVVGAGVTPRRVPRAPLNRARLPAAALRLCDAEGFQPLTMRRLAQELGAAPMAIYTHFRDKDELLAALLDHVVGLLEVPTGDREQTLRGFAQAARRTLLAHPGVVPLFTTVPALLPNSLRL